MCVHRFHTRWNLQCGGGAVAGRSEEARKESAREAARTRAERYGDQLKMSDPDNVSFFTR